MYQVVGRQRMALTVRSSVASSPAGTAFFFGVAAAAIVLDTSLAGPAVGEGSWEATLGSSSVASVSFFSALLSSLANWTGWRENKERQQG
jgi:hypothetical protein